MEHPIVPVDLQRLVAEQRLQQYQSEVACQAVFPGVGQDGRHDLGVSPLGHGFSRFLHRADHCFHLLEPGFLLDPLIPQ
ncbi:hypothetical protein D3C77_271470 [compost metagenome]